MWLLSEVRVQTVKGKMSLTAFVFKHLWSGTLFSKLINHCIFINHHFTQKLSLLRRRIKNRQQFKSRLNLTLRPLIQSVGTDSISKSCTVWHKGMCWHKTHSKWSKMLFSERGCGAWQHSSSVCLSGSGIENLLSASQVRHVQCLQYGKPDQRNLASFTKESDTAKCNYYVTMISFSGRSLLHMTKYFPQRGIRMSQLQMYHHWTTQYYRQHCQDRWHL